ncbi:3,4-dihydroxy-2-butanone-4-phosphate synthase [Benzoatithermus flavus]|uniref:3,4-dihydroxy-2-butanone 4-phosphate synthase n=1 Tax=Benzoatithermus flavus TaxID=3108223 RepID=A0ABU8XUP9_9PROT
MELNTIPEAIEAIAKGELVVVVDDTDRENEGDLIMAASKATPEKIAFMIRHTSGILCVPMLPERAARLNLQPMVANNLDPLRTAFTVSVDYKVGMTTGISAEERANTARALANDNCDGSDFIRPGHMFPLIARPGGVLTRSGHTEAAADLARLARLEPVGVLAEVVNDDGTVKRLPQLLEFARVHGLKIVTIEDLIQYRIRTEKFIDLVGEKEVAIGGLPVTIQAYRTPFDAMHHVVVIVGDVFDGKDVPCRIHREHPVSDLVARMSQSRTWLEVALDRFRELGRGVLVLVRNPVAEELGADGIEDREGETHGSARQRIQRWREIGVGAQILRQIGVRSIALLATREQHYVGLGGFGIEITRTIRVDE